jgi:hypothetical protein
MASNSPRNSGKSFEMIGFCGFNEAAEVYSAASMRLQKLLPQFHVTTEAASAVSMRPRKQLLNIFNRFSRISQ